MGHRLSRITTKTGDQGTSALASGQRLPKDSAIFQCLGDLDELNAYLGLTKCHLSHSYQLFVHQVQQHIMDVSGQVAMPELSLLKGSAIDYLESHIDNWNQVLPPLKEFVIPGNAVDSSHIHICRTIARRAERSAVAYQTHHTDTGETLQGVIAYLNRLSDALFVLARYVDFEHSRQEPQWQSDLKTPD